MNQLFKQLQKNKAVTSLLEKKGSFVVDDTLGIGLMVGAAFNAKPQRYNVITSNLYNAQKVYDLLSTFIGEENCLFFPVDEMLRVETISASKEMLAQRLFVMNELLTKENYVLITHTASVERYLPDPAIFKSLSIFFEVGKTYNLEEVKSTLAQTGYLRVNKIDQSMQFASRGDILDIYSVNNTKPVRLEFFGDELDSIRFFDIATQRSIESINNIEILPGRDLILTKEEKENAPVKILNQLQSDSNTINKALLQGLSDIVNRDIDMIKENMISENLYKYYGFVQDKHYSILDYSNDSINVICNRESFIHSSNMLLQETSDYFLDSFEQGTCLSHLSIYQDYNEVLNVNKNLYCKPLSSSFNDIVFNARAIAGGTNSINGARNLIQNYFDTSKKLILSLSTEQQKLTIIEILKDQDIEFEDIEKFDIPRGKVGVQLFDIENGFELVDEGIVVLTSKELLGYKNKMSRFLNRYKEAVILKSYEELQPGDYVVHEQNGIGKFLDITTLETDGIHRDYLHIQYAGSDVLYVPLEQFKLVRKFVGEEGVAPKLNKLNSGEWEKTKNRIKNRVNDIADKLLALYKERGTVKGYAFKEDDEFQEAFESQFPFELTVDQKRSMDEIKEDMEKPTPMDRLLCGDVGFGKTELAFRAAFKAISSGKQVALLCPTTLLARQHYERAMERFASFGVKIAIFSRLISEQRQKTYMEGIEKGTIHLAIGTHRLLSKEIHFKDLGLLIIDEEQRFGVEQKEKIKEIKSNVDVLTLTATPIPRTLQMSLVGIRNLSQLNSAPMNRMPIQTYVMPIKDDIIKELLERELARKGQVFYIHNQVSSIYSTASRLQKMVKEASIAIVHGQMDRDEIEDTMIKFYNAEIDILVCTSIIETGIDIPNANMIIIENADCFGLSQLYQIKGRVGRGNRIAYAYLLYRESKEMNEIARKRLKAIQEFTELGSGFKIAQRDLMIRGAGDILGAEQAGFIDTVGIDMYMKLLNEALEEKKNGKPKEEIKASKSIKLDAYIPSTYASKGDKIELYQEIEGAKTFQELDDLEKRVKDIYGSIPEEMNRLFVKRRIDFYTHSYWYKEMNEYPERIDIKCTKEFSCIDGIGMILFKELSNYLSSIKVNLLNKELKISLYKKGDWVTKYIDIHRIIYNVAQRYNENASFVVN